MLISVKKQPLLVQQVKTDSLPDLHYDNYIMVLTKHIEQKNEIIK